MSDEDLIKRGEVKAFRQAFIHYSGDYPDGRIAHAVTVEDIDRIPPAPHEMSAVEFLKIIENLNYYDHEAYQRYAWKKMQHDYAGAVAIVETWAEKHPKKEDDTP